MVTPTIADLARSIAENTTRVQEYLESNGLQLPSFDSGGPSESLVAADAPEIEAARLAVIDDTQQLRILMLGPREYLMSFQWTAKPRTERSRRPPAWTRVDVRRLMRHAITKRVFREVRKGVVAHTPPSRLLGSDAQLADWMGVNTGELWQAAAQTLNAMAKYPGSQEPNETGFSLANHSTKSAYQILAEYPVRAQRFGSAMQAFTEGKPYDVGHLVHNYPWDSLGEGTVVDVGGSNGFMSIGVAQAFPKLKFVVQDLAPVVADAKKAVPDAVRSRVRFMPYDFFTEQPVKGAAVYLFRWIFHNWSDRYAKSILENLIPALEAGSRVFVRDNVLPEPGMLPNVLEGRLRSMDLTMKEMQNARERELDEWAAFFESTDSRFKFQGGSKPTGSNLWILEANWEP